MYRAAALLAGLEHEDHVSGERVAVGGQQPGRPDEHGRMQVVPAGVHRSVDLAGEVQAGRFLHR
jgi:hypothetical protein